MFRFLFFLFSTFCLLSSVFVSNAYAKVDILNYFLPPNTQGNPVTTGEFFKPINNQDGTFTIQKSKDSNYYERFRIGANGIIYHLVDTTWATAEGNVTCDSTGNEAALTYEGGETPWIKGSMDVGETFTSAGAVIGRDKTTGELCTTPHNTRFQRSMQLAYQGCVRFPNGTASNDAIMLEITQGPGAGEQFFYDARRGWIGFNRGVDESGAYITEDLSGGSTPDGCLAVKITPAFCPRGYTCPDTSNKVVFGETIQYSKQVFGGYGGFSGETGPEQNDLRFPDFTQEANLFMDSEIIARSMPFELIKKGFPKLEIPNLSGILGHSGCERVTVNGTDAGPASIKNDELKRFPTTSSYNQLLLGFRFWESQYVENKGAQLKYRAGQPGDPEIPEHRDNCNDKDGESYQEATTVGNPIPPKNSLLTDIGGIVSQFFCSLGEGLGLTVCATVTVPVQQEKYLPGEIAFKDESHNFLDSFIPYEEKGNPVDQEETNPYKVFNDGRQEGVNYLGAKTTQQKTVELVKSLRPAEEAALITNLGPTGGLPSVITPTAGLNYTIAYNDKDIEINADRKAAAIVMAKRSWANTKLEELWDTVVNRSKEAGINPAFALAVWVEESGASHYSNHFSCPPSETNFQSSFQCFINTTNNIQPVNFAEWVRNYCGTPKDQPICSNDKNENFIRNLKDRYDVFVPPGTHGAAQPM